MTRHWFISAHYRHRANFTLVVVLLTFVVIMLGAYTRLTDAGLSCPDWPHCYGYLTAPHTTDQVQQASAAFPDTPVDTKKAWTEMTHRYLAGTLGILILIVSASLLFTRKTKESKCYIIAIGLVALLAMQVMLGMLTVTEKLKPVIVLAHLLTGLSLLLLLWWTYTDINLRDDYFLPQKKNRLTPWLWIGFIMVACQITLGGWVSTHYAGLACIDLPYCNTVLLPALHLDQINSDLITIHMLHRIGACITAFYVAMLSLYLLRNRDFRHLATLMLIGLFIQFTLGILTIIWLRPVWLALLHHGVAILLLLTIMTTLIKAQVQRRDRHYAS